MVPFITKDAHTFADDGCIFVSSIRKPPDGGMTSIPAYVMGRTAKPITLAIKPLTDEEKEIIRCSSLINFNRKQKKANWDGKRNRFLRGRKFSPFLVHPLPFFRFIHYNKNRIEIDWRNMIGTAYCQRSGPLLKL